MIIYKTKDGDVLDEILYKFYGTEGLVPKVLEHNRHLADLGPIYPSDVQIILPDLVLDGGNVRKEVSLWD